MVYKNSLINKSFIIILFLLMANVFGYSQTGASAPNMVTTNTAQTIPSAKTFLSSSNIFYGDGSNLTGITASLPTNGVTTDTVQNITAQKNFTDITSDTITSALLSSTKINGPLYVDGLGSSYNTPVGGIYPIGYTLSYAESPAITIVNSSNIPTTGTLSITLTPGVWEVTFQHALTNPNTQTTITGIALSRIAFGITASGNPTAIPAALVPRPSSGIWTYPLSPGSTVGAWTCNFGVAYITVTAASYPLYHFSTTNYGGTIGASTPTRQTIVAAVRIA